MIPSLETLLVEDFGLRSPTPLQRAICRIADGAKLGALAAHPDVLEAIGPLPPRCVPLAMLLLCGIRTAKSLIAGAAGVRCGLTCDTTGLLPGEVPRVAILATQKKQARAIYGHLLGAFRTSPRLTALLVHPPTETGETILFRHPSGRPVEISVVAGARAGNSLVSNWLAACIFDEAPRMIGADDGVVNLDDSRQAIAGRLLPSQCASEWLIGSPWAPFGPVYSEVTTRWKRSDSRMVVVRARGDKMNPVWWTPERAARMEREDPDAYRTDFLAEFADPETALIAGTHLDVSTRESPAELRPPEGDRYEYAAEMDPGTRSNAWTLIVTKMVDRKTVVCLAREWKGSKAMPLSSLEVLREIAGLLAPYKIAHSEDGRRRVGTDQWSVDALRDLGKGLGLDLIEFPATRSSNDDGYLELARRFELGEIELAPVPNLISDLRRLRRITTAGGVHIDLPETSDGRHCDFAPPLMRAAQRHTAQPAAVDPRPQWRREQDASMARAIKTHVKSEVPWWKRTA
jgi:hypothetical protein